MRHLAILTNSAEKIWRDCARKYQLSIIEMIKSLADGDATAFGSLIHRALEAWWKGAKESPIRECPECIGARAVDGETGTGDAASREASEHVDCSECSGSGVVGPGEWLRAAIGALASESDPFRRAQAEALIMGYHSRWSSMRWEGAPYDGQPIEVLAVEQEFRGPMLNPDTGAPSKTSQRGGKIDVLVRVAGDVWVVEHKTSSEDFGPGTPYRSRLRLDTQVSGYHVGARLLGHQDVRGVLYDVIGKPNFKPLKATPHDKRKYTKPTKAEPVARLYAGQRENDETPDEFQDRVLESIVDATSDYFARFEVVRLAHEEEAAARDTWQRAQEIRDAKRLGRFPRNPSSCTRFGRACEYLPICLGEVTANDGTRYRKAETPHEELGEKKEAA